MRPWIKLLSLCAVLIAAGSTFAREPDGSLGLIITPNDGIPAIVHQPGGSFEAVLTHQAELALKKDGVAIPVSAQWRELPGGRVQATCCLNDEAAPGLYALEAVTAEKTDQTVRAVYVQSEAPDYYLIAHLADTQIGKEEAACALTEAIRAVNECGAAALLITGNLTESGSPEEFKAFVDILDQCSVPTFVSPGPCDKSSGHYERFFGDLTYGFFFGKDGYLAFDSAGSLPANELGAQDGTLYRLRRQIRACRWSIAFTFQYQPWHAMRSQFVLFADDPIDYLVTSSGTGAASGTVPWGIPLATTPSAHDGYIRFYDVSAKGVRPREVQRVSNPAPASEVAQ